MVRAKKSLGQNFLTSKKIAEYIVVTAKVKNKDTVLEIGPGKGMLTTELLATGAHVVAIEKDAELVTILKEKFTLEITEGQLELIEGDALKINLQGISSPLSRSFKIVANIPYYITGQIIRKFLTSNSQPTSMTLLVQKEVAQRIARDKKESILSLSVKAYGKPNFITKVPAILFSPKPKVDSAILHISNISKNFFNTGDSISHKIEDIFFKVVKTGFAHKRKKLTNNLAELAPKEKILRIFKTTMLSENTRAEDVPLKKWKQIAKLLTAT